MLIRRFPCPWGSERQKLCLGVDGVLAGIVDFASVCKGSVFAEALPFLTGTAFLGNNMLRPGRVVAIFTSIWGRNGIQISKLEVLELACLVAAGFFGRVNENVTEARNVEWRDALHAGVIFDRRFEIAALIDA